MDNKHYKSISLTDIIRRSELKANGVQHHKHRGCLVGKITDEGYKTARLFNDPMRIDAIVFILCTKGSIQFSCNLEEYKVEEGSLLLLPPKSMVMSTVEEIEKKGYAVIFDPEFLGECNFNISRFTSLMIQITGQIHVKLTDSEQHRLLRGLEMLEMLIAEQVESPFREDVIRSMVETLMYQFCEVYATHINPDGKGQKISRQEAYFRQFLKELGEHYAERQGVTYYAEKLCISSRYLTTIVRRISGLTVTEWMNRFLVMEAKYLLKYSDLSIQEIAYRLSFPDQSFFGKHFKQHVGVSPSLYRAQH